MHIPRKRFGQHFLRDAGYIARIIDALSAKSTDHFVEIGAGQGALTEPLLKRVAELDIIELDRDLVPELEKLPHTRVFSADALTFNFAGLQQDARLLRLVGNLPYNISTPLIFHLLKYANNIADMVFMLQKEVALRLAAEINSKEMGRLSIMVQYCCEVDILFHVPPSAFYPSPKVESSMIRLKPYPVLPHRAQDHALFAALVKLAFSQRRKTLRKSLKSLVPDNVWQKLSIDPQSRPENLHVEQFVEMSNLLQSLKLGYEV